jgi:hypothetical protein
MSGRLLAATLVDLAEREFLIIRPDGRSFTFGQRRVTSRTAPTPTDLAGFEQTLIEKLFLPRTVRSSQADIDVRLGHRLFSRKIASIYLKVYDQLTTLGYFTENPEFVWQRYRSIGLLLLSVALAGFTATLAFMPPPKFPLVSWVGMMVASVLILRGAPHLPRRTRRGIEALREWLAFRRWLALPEPLTGNDASTTYRRWLPYAIALGVEVEWTRRLGDAIIEPPNWLVTSVAYVSIDDFARQLFPIVGYVGTQFAAVRDPNS